MMGDVSCIGEGRKKVLLQLCASRGGDVLYGAEQASPVHVPT